MKNLIILSVISVILLFSGCNNNSCSQKKSPILEDDTQKNESAICPILENEIRNFISYVDKNIKSQSDNYKMLYSLFFYKENNECYLWLSNDLFYREKNLKGYTFINDKLLVYYIHETESNISCNENFIKQSNLITFTDSISGYMNYDDDIYIEYEPIKRIFKIVSPDSLEIISTGFY